MTLRHTIAIKLSHFPNTYTNCNWYYIRIKKLTMSNTYTFSTIHTHTKQYVNDSNTFTIKVRSSIDISNV